MNEKQLEYLYQLVTPRRKKLFQKVSATRTRHFTVAVEDVGHLHNTSAVIRSCEAFGVQEVHVVEERFGKRIDREIAMGAQKWTTVKRYSTAMDSVLSLRDSGYRIVATTPHKEKHTLARFDIKTPAALFFGSEAKGLSDELIAEADDFIYIPTYGFTESLNISVSAAIILQDLMAQLRKSDIDWQLSEEDQKDIQLQWLRNHIKDADTLWAQFSENN